jgi:hypothetical protein
LPSLRIGSEALEDMVDGKVGDLNKLDVKKKRMTVENGNEMCEEVNSLFPGEGPAVTKFP